MAGHGDVSGVAVRLLRDSSMGVRGRRKGDHKPAQFRSQGPREVQFSADLIGFTGVNDAMAPLAGLRCCLHWVLRQHAEDLGWTGKWVPAGTGIGNEMDFLETARMACSSK